VETLNNPEGIPQLHLTLLAQDGLRTFALSDIQSLRFTSPRVQDDFRKALGVLAESHDADKKTIRLGFAGQGTRRVSVGYLTEAPAWKTAYRLVLDDKGAHFLQGWAIVENATDEDWKGVNLSLVSGRPISFVMDLATPRYIQRPVVRQTTAAGPAPQTYDDALSAPKSAPPRPAAAPMPSASSAKMAERSYAEASAADEMEDNYLAEELSAQSYGAGVAPGATMESAGNLVRYRIASPVDLGRRESAMFPLVDGIVAGKRVSVYDQRVDAKRPLAGVELTNSTAYSLLAGPMTIFDGGSYAGDALIDDFLPKAERLVTYAVDMETEVAPSPESSAQTILSMKIAKGIFNLSLSARREKAYTLKNSGSRDKEVILVKALEAAWKLLQPTKDVETTRDSYRFRVALPAGGNAALTVVEERTFGQSFGLASMNDTQFAYYSGMGTASPELKRAFAGIAERRAAVKATAADRQEAERKLKQVKDEQSRIRSNMGSLSNSSDLYKKYVAMLAEQESAIAALLESIDTLYARERRLSTELEAYIQSLQV
jgi:hypothetical protein